MASRGVIFSILSVIIAGMILMSGCGSEQAAQKAASADNNAGGTAGGQAAQSAEASGCTSPYDGTYSGTVSVSGERAPYSSLGEKTPYIITYNLEVTLECKFAQPCPEGGDTQCWGLRATHAKVSDPYFGCVNGCTPEMTQSTKIMLPSPGKKGGYFSVGFQNGAFMMVTPVLTEPDAKKIREAGIEVLDSIGTSAGINLDSEFPDLGQATFRCKDCYFAQQGFTMTLSKIS